MELERFGMLKFFSREAIDDLKGSILSQGKKLLNGHLLPANLL